MNKEELLHESLEQRMKGEKGKDWNRKNKTGRESVKEEDGGYPLETKAEERVGCEGCGQAWWMSNNLHHMLLIPLNTLRNEPPDAFARKMSRGFLKQYSTDFLSNIQQVKQASS